MAKVLVTGAQGCIGSWVVKHLLERGDEVLIYDLDPQPVRIRKIVTPDLAAKLEIVAGQIEDSKTVKELVKHREVTHVVHLAAVLMPFCQAQPVMGGLIDVIGTLNVFEAARDAGRPVRVVYASSSAAWGPEHDLTRPATHYGVFKQANEGNARVFYTLNGISSIGLRPWAVYGYGRDLGLTADPTLAMKAVVDGKPFEIRIGGKMDLQYVEDVAEAFVASLYAPVEGAHVCDLAGDVISMEELIALIDSIRPGAARLLRSHGPHVPVVYGQGDALFQQLVPGVRKTALRDGIARTMAMFEREMVAAR